MSTVESATFQWTKKVAIKWLFREAENIFKTRVLKILSASFDLILVHRKKNLKINKKKIKNLKNHQKKKTLKVDINTLTEYI